MKRTLLIINILLLALYGCSADKLYELHNLEGSISSTNNLPLGGVSVSLTTVDSVYTTITDEQGIFCFTNIPGGLGMFTINKEDYITQQKRIAIGYEINGSMNYVLHTFFEESYLEISTPPITLHNSETKAVFSIRANTTFTVSHQGDWLQTPEKVYQPGESIVITTAENETSEERIAEITITGEYGQVKKTTLRQKAGPVLRAKMDFR